MALSRKYARLLVEVLEDRTVPATLVSPNRVTFQDIDGDLAEVVFSKPVLNEGFVNDALLFNTSSVNGNNSSRQSLRQLNLVFQGSSELEGSDITVRVTKKAPRGDGEVHIGQIYSYGQSYGQLRFAGDVGQFTMFNYSGDEVLAEKLDVNSIGRFDPQGNSIFSDLRGSIGTLRVRGDLGGAVLAGVGDGDPSRLAIQDMIVGGSIKGSFNTSNRITQVTINGNLDGTAFPQSTVGAFFSGAVEQFILKGSILGSKTGGSGQLSLNAGPGEIGTVSIAGSVRGDSHFSGNVALFGGAESLTINGSIVGGAGEFSGWVQPGETRNIVVKGSILGGSGPRSGLLSNQTFEAPYTQTTESVTIGGNLVGGTGEQAGQVRFVNPVNRFRLHGSLRGGAGAQSGQVSFDTGVTEAILNDISGGAGEQSGLLQSSDVLPDQAMHFVFVHGSVQGGAGVSSGTVSLLGSHQLRINGSVFGSTGEQSGNIRFGFQETPLPLPGSLSIRGSLRGGAGVGSGNVSLASAMDLVSIGGDIVGSTGFVSGSIQFGAHINTIAIAGNLLGGSTFRSGSIVSYFSEAETIRIGKSLRGGSGEESGGIAIERGDVQLIYVAGNIVGGTGTRSAVIQTQSLETLQINGSILGGNALLSGGVFIHGRFTSAVSRLGTARVGGDIAGNYGYIYVGWYLGQGYLESLLVGGSIRDSAVISSGAIGTMTVRGSITARNGSESIVSANGAWLVSNTPGQPYLLNSLTVGGSVINSRLLFSQFQYEGVLPARVGTITVGKNWQNSQLIVGYAAGADDLTGTEDDVRLTAEASTLDSLVIAGKVLGPATSLIQAALVSQLQLGQTLVTLNDGELNDVVLLSQLLRVYEKA